MQVFKSLFLLAAATLCVLAAQPAQATYWNLFNEEGESSKDSIYITYASLLDMLNDTNRKGNFSPGIFGDSAQNVVGSGAMIMRTPLTPVPAPGSLPLLGLGLAALGITRWRRAH